ncbi:MAG TPA: membrane protein insertion efficiency factor YidD [Gammaproteobacteria bacterium]|nr:membrane protein insertion efficiency factor YidD [Gammaproteobacteria bacterium]
MSKPLIFLIKTYKYFISPLLGQCCRFYPTCSSYAMDAIHSFGCFYGTYLTLKRILRCHPWGKSGYDPIPETITSIKSNKEVLK